MFHQAQESLHLLVVADFLLLVQKYSVHQERGTKSTDKNTFSLTVSLLAYGQKQYQNICLLVLENFLSNTICVLM